MTSTNCPCDDNINRSHTFIKDPLSGHIAAVIRTDLMPDLPDGSKSGNALRCLVDDFLMLNLPGLRQMPGNSYNAAPHFFLHSADREDIWLQLTPNTPEALAFRQAVVELSEARPPSAESFLLWAHRQLEQLYQNADRADEYKAIIERLVANDRAGSHLQ